VAYAARIIKKYKTANFIVLIPTNERNEKTKELALKRFLCDLSSGMTIYFEFLQPPRHSARQNE
jgi:hypothetical protein